MENTMTKKRTRISVQANEQTVGSMETMGALVAVSVLIGGWAVACFVGAMISAGGPLALAKGFFQAVTGM